MSFDFDRDVERRGTDSIKWGKYAGQDILPLWVADTDFMSPPAVVSALQRRVEHGVFGYGEAPPELVETTVETLDREFSWPVKPEWLVWLPGLVCGLSVTCRAVGKAGDGVLVMTPVYPPFLKVPSLMDRELETVSLSGGNTAGWTLDRRRLAAAVSERTRLLMLCHPHNPVGRLWRREELALMAEVCLEKRLLICSDEIHNQLILEPGLRHVPLATLGPEVAARTITLLAPSKTFNIAGLGCSVAVIPDERIRRRFERAKAGIVPGVNVLGYIAALAAWRDGREWLAAQLEYLRANRDYLAERVSALSQVTLAPIEATYLAWLDVQQLGLEHPAAFFESHGLGLSDGREFGGPGYLRLNFGCPRSTLVEACDRLDRAVAASS